MSSSGIRAARNFSAGAVAAIAAWSSYSHMVHVALAYGERPQVAYALPFSVDGMLIVASVVMVDDKRRAHRVRPIARLAFTAGVVASIAANIAAAQPSIGARIVDAWPAVALLLVVEMLARPPAVADGHVPPVRATQSRPPSAVAARPPHVEVPAAPELPPLRQVPRQAWVPADSQVPAQGDVPLHPQLPAELPPPLSHEQASVHGSAREIHPAMGARATGRLPHQAHLSQAEPSASDVAAPARRLSCPAMAECLPPRAGRLSSEELPPVPPVRASHDVAHVPLVAAFPPSTTAAAPHGTSVPPEADPPQPEPSAQVDWRRQTVVGRGDGRRGPRRRSSGNTRRPTAVTLHLARQIIDAEPDLPRTEVAARLGVSTRRLREVLATGA